MPEEIEQIPVSLLNAYCYCPRRFYYEHVLGLWQSSEDTEEGDIKHRRIEALEGKKRKEEDLIQWRNYFLSSETLSIVGKIDILEEKDGMIYPVEYKKGKLKLDENEEIFVYDNDKIQLCAAALLLKENKISNPTQGFVYFVASKKRVPVKFDEELITKTLETIQYAKNAAKLSTIPSPLDSGDKRCEKCSLVSICIPEETLYMKNKMHEPQQLRKIIPLSSEEGVVYINSQGSYISKNGDCLKISNKTTDSDQSIPMIQVRQVVIFGNAQISSQALNHLLQNEIPVIYLSMYGKFLGYSASLPNPNAALRISQYETFSNTAKRLACAKGFIKSKIHNQRTILMRYNNSINQKEENSNSPNREITDESQESENKFCETETKFVECARQLKILRESVKSADSTQVLLGIEGAAARIYFSLFNIIIKKTECSNFNFQKRNRRPPEDPVNAMLSLSYSLLLKDCLTACMTVGLDPYIGFYHQPKHGRPALALDIMEEFRPIIADSVVFYLTNNKILKNEDFYQTPSACYLNDKGRKKFFEAYEKRINEKIQHPLFGYTISYNRIIETQARLLARFITGEIDEYAGFEVR